MVTMLMGKKLGMTQIFDEHRRLRPVTVIEAGPCHVTAVKTKDQHGYDALQLGYMEVQERRLTRAQVGHLRASGQEKLFRHLWEVRGVSPDCHVGDAVTAGLFEKGELVHVQGTSKGKGFQGVMKRHNFSGGPASHGSMFHRAPGSVGSSSYPSRVLKNKALPGQTGNKRVTVQGLQVLDIRQEESLVLISGAVPGPVGGLVFIQKSGRQ